MFIELTDTVTKDLFVINTSVIRGVIVIATGTAIAINHPHGPSHIPVDESYEDVKELLNFKRFGKWSQ